MEALTVRGDWKSVFRGRAKASLEALLPDTLKTRRWFGGKARAIRAARIVESVSFPPESPVASFLFVGVDYADGAPETYAFPLAFAAGVRSDQVQRQFSHAVVARLRVLDKGEEGVLYDALWEKSFLVVLLEMIIGRRRVRGTLSELAGVQPSSCGPLPGPEDSRLEPSILKAEQSNTSVVYGDRFILKVFRRLEAGVNPDLEIGCFLTARGFAHVPPVAGAIECRRGNDEPGTLAILQGFVPNRGDAWKYTLTTLERYFDRVRTRAADLGSPPLTSRSLKVLLEEEVPALAREAVGSYLEEAGLLGRRTAELHLALSLDMQDPNFSPEPFSEAYRLAIYRSMMELADRAFHLLRLRSRDLPEAVQGAAQKVLDLEGEIRARFLPIRDGNLSAMRIRCHGDYHLGQVLYTSGDFTIIDFEGEPARSLEERRQKLSALRDVAGMLRSFHYAAYAALFAQSAGAAADSMAMGSLESWARFWDFRVSGAFLRSYLQAAGNAPFVPQTRDELQVLLEAFVLEKAVYELAYELNNRPDWVKIPLQGILEILGFLSDA